MYSKARVADPPRADEPQPLPRGRHKLSRADVRESQRRRLIRAMLDLVAERGYPATTVGDVVAAARCSRNAFYELFEDKEACYIAAADETGAEMLEALVSGAQQADSWLEALRSGTHSYLLSSPMRSRHDHRLGPGKQLPQRDGDVAGAGRHVDHQRV